MKARLMCFAVLLTAIVYLPGITGGFAFDDYANIVQNRYLTDAPTNLDDLRKAVWSGEAGPFKRPIAMLSFALNNALTGHWPMGYKITNLVIHLINGVLAFFCALLLLKAHLNQREDSKKIVFLSAIAATVWLVHPLNLTSVLYVVQRMTSLAALFSFAAVIAYCLGRVALIDGKRLSATLLLLIAVPVTVMLGALSKENALLVLPTLGAVEYFLFRFRGTSNQSTHYFRVTFQMLTIVCVLVASWYLFLHRPEYLAAGFEGRPFTLLERVLTEMRVLWFYFSLLALPQLGQFGLFHDDILLSTGLLQPVSTLAACLGVFFALSISLLTARRWPMLGFCIVWYLIGHSMESTIFPLELVHEHRNYFPSFGIILGITYLMSVAFERVEIRHGSSVITVLIILTLSGLTYLRAQQWSDPVTLAITEAEHHPTSYRSVYAAGRVYFGLSMMRGDQIYFDKSAEHLIMAAALDKSAKRPYFGLMKLARINEKPIPEKWRAELLYRLQHTLFSHTDWTELHLMVKCRAEFKDCNVPRDDVLAYFQASLSNDTISPQTKSQLLLDLAVFYVNEVGESVQASELLAEAVSLTPNKFELRLTYAEILMLAEKYDDLAAELNRIEATDYWQDAHTYSSGRIEAIRRRMAEKTHER